MQIALIMFVVYHQAPGAPVASLGQGTEIVRSAEAAKWQRFEGRYDVPKFVVSDDGSVMFTMSPRRASAFRLPELSAIDQGHDPTYYVVIRRNPLSSLAFTVGQELEAVGHPITSVLDAPVMDGGLCAAKSAVEWADARVCGWNRAAGNVPFVVLSKISQSETRGAKNVSGPLRLSVDPGTVAGAAYGPHGMPLAAFEREYGVDKLGRVVTRDAIYALDSRGRVRPWKPARWHSFLTRKDVRRGRAGGEFYAGGPETIPALDPRSGRAAVPDRDSVQEWDSGRRRLTKRRLPAGTMIVKLYYLKGRLFLETAGRAELRALRDHRASLAVFSSALRLWVADASGWREVGPYYIYGTSENGRYVVARNVKADTWWRFDSGT